MININNLKNWLRNVSIQRKFLPLQWFIITIVVLISLLSISSVVMVNIFAETIIDVNVSKREQLNAIVRNMYVCRVLGRDILLQEDEQIRAELYEDYIASFDELDYKMDEFAARLDGDKLTEFNSIIEEKNKYKESMILSADIRISGGEYSEALYALQVVTPIANEFFGSIDAFLETEGKLMELALTRNDALVFGILFISVVFNFIVIFALLFFVKYFSKTMSASLISLERCLSEIAETGNMKIEIPKELYSNDEVGKIASVTDKMKTMLLEYSFNDTLTGGYNAKAYHEEVSDIFSEEKTKKEIWCVIADMNNLKLINDILGHMEGDNAIRKSYYALNQNFKQYGKTFRVGGDEFVSLLTGCDESVLVEKINLIVTQIEESNSHAIHKFSLAIGYNVFTGYTKDEFGEFFKLVDKQMYDNKAEIKQARMNSRISPDIGDDNR